MRGEYSQVLGRPQTRSRIGEQRAKSQEPRLRPQAPLRRPCVPRAPSAAKAVQRVEVDPRELVLQEIKSRAAGKGMSRREVYPKTARFHRCSSTFISFPLDSLRFGAFKSL